MIGLDTNILIRFIVNDDHEQALKVKSFIDTHKGPRAFFIANITICELIWVLLRGYRYTKLNILQVLNQLMIVEDFCFENTKILKKTIHLYEKGKADFADYLTFSIHQDIGCQKTISFDQKLLKEGIFFEV